MISVEEMSDEELERHALEILGRELGPRGLARFLRKFRAGNGDYTAERNGWLGKTTVRDAVKAVNSRRRS
jgi:hypothetical protein